MTYLLAPTPCWMFIVLAITNVITILNLQALQREHRRLNHQHRATALAYRIRLGLLKDAKREPTACGVHSDHDEGNPTP